MALRGMSLRRAQAYLGQVLEKKSIIPFRRHTGGVGRKGQAMVFNTTQGRWPVKSVEIVLGLLKNLESNAEVQGLAVNGLQLTHLQVQRAQKQRRRTYRAHGRINAYMASPCHIEIIATEKEEKTPKAASTAVAPK